MKCIPVVSWDYSACMCDPESEPQEARRLVKAGLPIPAYMQLLKLSHCFNVMDARGAVGVTLRATCFGALRMLAKQIAGEASPSLFH